MKLDHKKLLKLIEESEASIRRGYVTEESYCIGEIDGIQVTINVSGKTAYFKDLTGSECICLK